MTSGSLYRLTAFSTNPEGGNPARVWIGNALPDPVEMQRIAPASGQDRIVRYYSPEAEVSFCGHATIASGVQLGGKTFQSLLPQNNDSWQKSFRLKREYREW